MHYLKRSLSEQEKRHFGHFGHFTLNARWLAPYLPGQRGLLVVFLMGVQRLWKDRQDLDICKGQRSVHEFVSASISEPKLLGWHSATTASVLEMLWTSCSRSLVVSAALFLVWKFVVEETCHHSWCQTLCSLPWCSGSRLTRRAA